MKRNMGMIDRLLRAALAVIVVVNISPVSLPEQRP